MVETFITDTLASVDNVIGQFVQTGYTNLVSNNMTVITLAMTAYVVWMGYQFMMHKLPLDLSAVSRLLLLIVVYALLNEYTLFQTFFYNIFTNEPGELIKTIVASDPSSGMKGQGVNDALNKVYSQGMTAAGTLFAKGGLYNLQCYLFGALVFAATLLCCLVALAYMIYAKMALAVMLVLAPIFLLFLLWESTRELFNKWIQSVFNYAMIPVVLSGMLMLTLSIIHGTLDNLNAGALVIAHGGTPPSGTPPSFFEIIPFVGLTLLSALLYVQVLPIAAALSGGMALTAISAAIPMAQKALKMSGLTGAAKGAGSLVNKGFQKAKAALSERRQQKNTAKGKQVSRDK